MLLYSEVNFLEENLLVSKAKGGDSNALTDLIKRYSETVLQKSLSFKKISGIENEDLYQEGMLGLLSAVYSAGVGSGVGSPGVGSGVGSPGVGSGSVFMFLGSGLYCAVGMGAGVGGTAFAASSFIMSSNSWNMSFMCFHSLYFM